MLDLEQLVADATTALKAGAGVSTGGAIAALRGVLGVLLTPGLNEDIDRVCRERLGICPAQGVLGFCR